MPLHIALSYCSLFFIRNTFSKTASSPTKHAELMGMGIPVICNTIGDTGNIITATQSGLLVDQFDDASLRAALTQLDSTEKIDKEYIRDCALSLFDLQNGIVKYFSLYKDILPTPLKTPHEAISA